jgi:hypothetical protein
MAKPKTTMYKLLTLLDSQPVSIGKIRELLKIDRKTEYRNCKEAEKEGWIEKDKIGKYHVTPVGKSVISLSQKPVDSVSFEVDSQIIDFIKTRSDRPKAKCTIVIKNAKEIKELDDKTCYVERFITHDGLGLVENDTYLKQVVAIVVDTILDFKAKDKGLFTILDQQFRDEVAAFNSDTYYPSYDYRKRYIDLADINFTVLIKFEGKKWVESQNFQDLEKNIQANRRFYDISEGVKLMDRSVRINKAIYTLLGGGGELTKRGLEGNRLFSSETELMEFVHNCLKIWQVGKQDEINKLMQEAFKCGYFQIEKKELYHLKIDKTNKVQFFDFLNLNDKNLASSKEENSLASSQEMMNAKNIVELASKELDVFEKAFFDLLMKLVEKFENAKMYDNVVDTSQIRNGKQPPHLTAAENSLLRLLYIFHTVENVYMRFFMKLSAERRINKYVQSRVHMVVITRLAEMRKTIYQALSSFHGGRFNSYFNDIHTEGLLQEHFKVFQESQINVQPFLKSVDQIYQSVN